MQEEATMGTLSMASGLDTSVAAPLDEAIARTKAALKEQGFGVLTEIDVRQTLREKIGVDFAPYVILGACNPGLAHRALQAEPSVGLLLPCNVVVREAGGRSEVAAVDPEQMLGMFGGDAEIRGVAAEAAAGLRAAIAALAANEAGTA